MGAIAQGQSAAAAGRYNAQMADQNAIAAQEQATAAAAIQQEHAKKQIGATIAGYGASGVTMDGSPLDVLAESASSAERDKQNILYKGQLQAAGYTDQAQLDSAAASNAAASGYMSATGILAGGGAKIAGMGAAAPAGGANAKYGMDEL